jgi:phenylacetate-CoA ligase
MSRAEQIQKAFYDAFTDIQYWPREKIREFQATQLARLLKHAREYVPFYRDRLDAAFDSNGRFDWSRWTDIPILTRSDVMESGERMQSLSLPTDHGGTSRSTTSGSTGAPLTIVASFYSGSAARAAMNRCQTWQRLDWSKDVLFYTEERENSGVWPNVESGRPWGPPWMPQSTGRSLRFNGDTPPTRIIDFINEHHIPYLSCRAKVAQVLAIEAERLGRSAQLDAVFAFSTATYQDERNDVARVLGGRIISFYSSKEGHLMAYQCPTGNHLHISEDTALIELVDADNRPVPPGTPGRVVVTNLFNWAQPFVRYEHGDIAVETAEPCPCGRSFRSLKKIVGRVTDMFRFVDGTSVAFALPENVKRDLKIKTWQVAQIGPMHLEVRYSLLSDGGAIDTERADAIIRARTHPLVIITFVEATNFLPASGKKFAEYINEFNGTSDQSPTVSLMHSPSI